MLTPVPRLGLAASSRPPRCPYGDVTLTDLSVPEYRPARPPRGLRL